MLRSADPEVELIEVDDDARPGPAELAGRADVVASGAALHDAAVRGDGAAAVRALDEHRLLCAHRLGPAAWRTGRRWRQDGSPSSIPACCLRTVTTSVEP